MPFTTTKLTLTLAGPTGPAGAQGATGAAGPNEITLSTDTAFVGYIYGNGTNVAGATQATDLATASTLVLRNSSGNSAFNYVFATGIEVGQEDTATGVITFIDELGNGVALSNGNAGNGNSVSLPQNSGTLALVEADSGLIYSADIQDATDLATASTLVLRNSSGNSAFNFVFATGIEVGQEDTATGVITFIDELGNGVTLSNGNAANGNALSLPQNSGTLAIAEASSGLIYTIDIQDASFDSTSINTVVKRDPLGFAGIVVDNGGVSASTSLFVDHQGFTLVNFDAIPTGVIELVYFGNDLNGNHIWGLQDPPTLPDNSEHAVVFYDPTFAEPASLNVGAWLFSYGNGVSYAIAYAPNSSGLGIPPLTNWTFYDGSGIITAITTSNTLAPAGSFAYDSAAGTLNMSIGLITDFATGWRSIPLVPIGQSVVPVFIQPTQPDSSGSKYLWLDTSGGNLQIKYEDGL